MTRPPILVTCEHGGRHVPARYEALFRGAGDVLRSHRGWDPGALALARRLARASAAPLRFSRVTRLLVDLNRSPDNPTVFSDFSMRLSGGERRRILRRYHRAYRTRVRRLACSLGGPRNAPLVHLSVHTFVPVLEGIPRSLDVGVLFDPDRRRERDLAKRWMAGLARGRPDLRIGPNAPYRGVDDGLTTWLRTELPEERYLGIELELSQHRAWGELEPDGSRIPPPEDPGALAGEIARAFLLATGER
jgi:predicted N-formylglutamate amidohydrolase